MQPPLIDMRGIVKTYPGVRALDSVDFTLNAGEIHALVGENGAGKSTLIRILTGAELPDAGLMRLRAAPYNPRSPQEAQHQGVAAVYQEINLLPDLSVAENLLLGREPRSRLGRIDWPTLRRLAAHALAELGVDVDVRRPLRSCSIAVQQLIAITRALRLNASVLVLDEPTSSLDAGEVDRLFTLMRSLRERGMGIIFITHFLEQIHAVSDRITILRNGRLIETRPAADLSRLELVSLMLGKHLDTAEPTPIVDQSDAPADTKPLLHADALCRRGFGPFDLTLHAGETLGLAGLLGSGRSELIRLLFGIDRCSSGRLTVNGRNVSRLTPRRAIRLGMALAPEDRRASGLVAHLSVRENMLLALRARRGLTRTLPRREQRRLVDRFLAALSISVADIDQPVRTLSGGNQQKVILARWLLLEPTIFMLDEPTRGIDIGARKQIEDLIENLRARGMAIILVSGELEEVVRLSRRILILRDRRTVGELAGAAITLSAVMQRIAAEHGGRRDA